MTNPLTLQFTPVEQKDAPPMVVAGVGLGKAWKGALEIFGAIEEVGSQTTKVIVVTRMNGVNWATLFVPGEGPKFYLLRVPEGDRPNN